MTSLVERGGKLLIGSGGGLSTKEDCCCFADTCDQLASCFGPLVGGHYLQSKSLSITGFVNGVCPFCSDFNVSCSAPFGVSVGSCCVSWSCSIESAGDPCSGAPKCSVQPSATICLSGTDWSVSVGIRATCTGFGAYGPITGGSTITGSIAKDAVIAICSGGSLSQLLTFSGGGAGCGTTITISF